MVRVKKWDRASNLENYFSFQKSTRKCVIGFNGADIFLHSSFILKQMVVTQKRPIFKLKTFWESQDLKQQPDIFFIGER